MAFLKEKTMTTLSTSPASSPLASLKINHAAIRVPDFDEAVTWYADKLDFRSKQTVSVAGLSFGFLYPAGNDSFHFELMAGPGAAERLAYKDLHDSYNMSGWHHPGFSVDSVDAVVDELKRRDVTIASEPHDVPAMGLRVAFFADPWGNLFEVIQSIAQ
jgi:catechol 2,3-dioxygenase-like lactoylglutathione lyase family enzyme